MLKPETNDMNRYLQMTDIIDFRHNLVRAAAEKLRTDVMKKSWRSVGIRHAGVCCIREI